MTEVETMTIASQRNTSLTLDAATLYAARELGVNVSVVADTALRRAVAACTRGIGQLIAGLRPWHGTYLYRRS